MAEGTKPPQISPDYKWWWDGVSWRPIASPALVVMMRVLEWAVIGLLCWTLLPVGIVLAMVFITPNYWLPMFSPEGLGLVAAAIAAIGVSVGLAALARRLA